MNRILAIIVLIFGITSCAKSPEHVSEFVSKGNDTYAQYSAAQESWQSHSIANYQITVHVFSSLLSPPCSSEFVLVVQQGAVVDVLEVVAAETIQVQDGTEIQNPECADYERYEISSMLNEIALLLDEPNTSQAVGINFDKEFGYIESFHLHYENSEAVKEIIYSDFMVMANGSSD